MSRQGSRRLRGGLAAWWLLTGCSVDDQLLDPIVPRGAGDAASDAETAASPDAGADAEPCAIDLDGDGACANDDCDDADEHRSPLLSEYCPDNLDNDCDEQIDFEDECGTSNDTCDDAIAILTQDAQRDTTFWPFVLPLGEYQDDYKVGDPADTGVCAPIDSRGGDAVFELRTTTNALLDLRATGRDGARPVLVLRMGCSGPAECDRDERQDACARGSVVDRCDQELDGATPSLAVEMAGSRTAFLIVDDLQASRDGRVELEVRIERVTQ